MPTYTVHEPQPAAKDFDERATSLVFVKEGFAWLGFLVPALWLLFHRLWLGFIVYVLITWMVGALASLAGGNATAVAWAMVLINLGFGFEARDIHRAALARKGYALIGVVTGRDLEAAERRFLAEWLPNRLSVLLGPATFGLPYRLGDIDYRHAAWPRLWEKIVTFLRACLAPAGPTAR